MTPDIFVESTETVSVTAGRPLRIAFLGPVGSNGGVAGMGRVLMVGQLRLGAEVDYYTTTPAEQLPRELTASEKFRAIGANVGWGWQWGKWYNRNRLVAFISSAIFRIRDHKLLTRLLIAANHDRRYDVIFQLSQQELFELGKQRAQLPPIVVHPCSHAAGELRWHRRESRYALEHERRITHYVVRAIMIYRAYVQKCELRKPMLIVGPSERFNELLNQDYGVDRKRTAVLRHPLLMPTTDVAMRTVQPSGPILLSAVMRISVRKGVEQIVELSKRLNDLQGRVRIKVVGGSSLFSDYSGHLRGLNPAIAEYVGDIPYSQMTDLYDRTDGLLVPSRYEPGSLAVGEALARGVGIIASREVGPSEVLPASVCYAFEAGDMDAFENQVRRFVSNRETDRLSPRQLAIDVANDLFSSERVARTLFDLLTRVARPQATKEHSIADANRS